MMQLSQHKALKPGSWIRIPIIYETTCKTKQKNAYHHAIVICPLLEIGFNAAGTIIDKLHITSQNNIYDCSAYEVINEPINYKQCEDIIIRALTYYGKKNYSQIFNNCEHFASYSFNNKSESKQVKHTFWNNTSYIHKYIQQSSLFTNTMLLLNQYNIVSNKTVNNICETNYKFGKFNGKIIDFCDNKADLNKLENKYNIKTMNNNYDNCDNDVIEQKYDDIDIVKEAKMVRLTIRNNLNNNGYIERNKIDVIINTIKPILTKYYNQNDQ